MSSIMYGYVYIYVNDPTLYSYVHFTECKINIINELSTQNKDSRMILINCAFDKCHFNKTKEEVFQLCKDAYFEGNCTFGYSDKQGEEMTKNDQQDTFDHVDEILSLAKGSVLEAMEDFEVPAMSYLGTEVTKLLPVGTRVRLTRDDNADVLTLRGLAALEEVSLRVTIPVEQWHLLKVIKRMEKEKRDEESQKQNSILFAYGADDNAGG